MNVVAHRGASVAEVENTPAAFVTADRLGADGVELDVRIAGDGRGGLRLVVHHDPLPTRPDEVASLADLDEVLAACGERMLVNVEIKNSESEGGFDPTMAVVAPTIALMRRVDPRPDRWLVSSFSRATVGHVRLLAPELATAQLCTPLDGSTIERCASDGHVAIHPSDRHLTESAVRDAHDAGLLVNVWTVNDPDRIVELDRWGVDGVCTDVPDVALAALDRDGGDQSPSWSPAPGA